VPRRRSRRGNIVATLAAPDASDASANPPNLDDWDAGGRIWRSCTRLRALWGVFPVVVRVHSGAFFRTRKSPDSNRFGACGRRRSAPTLGRPSYGLRWRAATLCTEANRSCFQTADFQERWVRSPRAAQYDAGLMHWGATTRSIEEGSRQSEPGSALAATPPHSLLCCSPRR